MEGVSPRIRSPLTAIGTAALAWSFYWLPLIWGDVRGATALGQGLSLAELGTHHVFQLLFVAAHGGIRWLAGLGVLLAVAFLIVRRRRRVRRSPQREGAERLTVGVAEPQPVQGD